MTKSFKMKNLVVKKPLNKICSKEKLQRKRFTTETPAVKKCTKEKSTVKVSSLKAKFLTAIKLMKKI